MTKDHRLQSTISVAQGLGNRVEPTSCLLHVVFPPASVTSFTLDESERVVGRDPGSGGFVLDHGTVSRRHAAVIWSAALGTHAVRDLGSSNGTFADGTVVKEAARPVLSGSVVRMGNVLCVYEQVPAVSDDDATAVSTDAIPGQAAAIRRLRGQVQRAARDPASVLIIGETGTGKERIAEEIHRLSGRGGRLVPLNCAALAPQLVESQLFGHVKGAFTGAGEAQAGLFRAADGGSIFLDEIGELAIDLQPKLLRVLQSGEVLAVGATRAIRVDVRVIAATNRDLGSEAARTGFRADLYARLSLWELRVPALRERRIDLLGWIDRLHAHWNAQRGLTATKLEFDAEAAEALLRSSWPLNLRGLDRLVHELGSHRGARIPVAALPAWIGGTGSYARPASRPSTPAVAEPVYQANDASDVDDVDDGSSSKPDLPSRDEFTTAYADLGGNISALAKRFDRDRRQIYRWAKAFGLR